LLRAGWRLLAGSAAALYTASWWLPVILVPPVFPKSPTGPPDIFYARKAIAVAFSPALDPTRPTSVVEALGQVLAVASGLTNLLFVIIIVVLIGGRVPGKRVEVAVWVAVVINLIWFGTPPSNLRVGYFFWEASFVFLALAVRGRRQVPPATVSAPLMSAV
jgi:hypothetical protein